jgi:hypothetical protein
MVAHLDWMCSYDGKHFTVSFNRASPTALFMLERVEKASVAATPKMTGTSKVFDMREFDLHCAFAALRGYQEISISTSG